MSFQKLWYDYPALSFTEALPFGNGNFGGMLYGDVSEEKISLNSDTLWSGYKTRDNKEIPIEKIKRVRELIDNQNYEEAERCVKDEMLGFFNESYMPIGNFYIRCDHQDNTRNYRRELDLETGIVTVSYSINMTHVTRKLFASYPDDVIVLKYEAIGKEKMNLEIHFESLLNYSCELSHNQLITHVIAPTHVDPIYCISEHPIVYDKENEGIHCTTIAEVFNTDGTISTDKKSLKIENAEICIFVLATANGFKKYNLKLEQNDRMIDSLCQNKLLRVRNRSYCNLLSTYLLDYQKLFKRVFFSLSGDYKEDVPTDKRLNQLRDGKEDQEIFTLFFQFGRYLMITSSRPGSQPSTLQGLWNEEIRPAWSSNYTSNINVEMNYWMANSANLSECEEPLIDMLCDLREVGAKTAKSQYHCRGFAANHNIDLWRQTGPVGGEPKYAYWPLGGAWLATHAFMHYEYTQDINFLKDKGYGILHDAALFCMDWMYEDKNGEMATCPSTTPENVFLSKSGKKCSISKSTTMDLAIIRELLGDFIVVAELLKRDGKLVERAYTYLNKIPDYKIGPDGCIQEWYEPFKEEEKGHRHFSPLYGLYPGNSISYDKDSPILEACNRFLTKRMSHGSGHTGWSCAWLICLYARLRNSELAYKYLHQLIAHSTYKNLFDLHPPLGERYPGEKEVFQIDGNFGGVAAMVEMLVQYVNGRMYFLPALPSCWPKGKIRGIKTRHGHEIMLEWEKKKLCCVDLRAGRTEKVLIYTQSPVRIISKNNNFMAKPDLDGYIDVYLQENEEYKILYE